MGVIHTLPLPAVWQLCLLFCFVCAFSRRDWSYSRTVVCTPWLQLICMIMPSRNTVSDHKPYAQEKLSIFFFWPSVPLAVFQKYQYWLIIYNRAEVRRDGPTGPIGKSLRLGNGTLAGTGQRKLWNTGPTTLSSLHFCQGERLQSLTAYGESSSPLWLSILLTWRNGGLGLGIVFSLSSWTQVPEFTQELWNFRRNIQ